MGTRRKGRELALKIIYSMYDQNAPIAEVLQEFWKNFKFQDDILGEPVEDVGENIPDDEKRFAEDLIQGVDQHLERNNFV